MTDATAQQDSFVWPDDAWQVSLPTLPVTTTDVGWGEPAAFTVPPGTTALQLEYTARTGHVLQLAALESPLGAIVADNWLKLADQPWLNPTGQERVRATAWQAAFLVPNAPGIEVVPGLWQVRPFAFDYDPVTQARQPTATELDLRVTLLRKPGWQGGKVDVNFCLIGARGITAATAPDHPRVRDALQTLTQAWQPVGLQLGEVRYFDVPAKRLDVTHDDGADEELAALLRLTAGQPPGIPVFLLESVNLRTAAGIVPAAGVTAGLPMPTTMGGPRTGIVLALQYDQPDLLGVVLAHELGHALGLYHVAEAGDGGATDRLDDTSPDVPNLMQYAPDPKHLTLTPQQGAVLRTGPWVGPR